MPHEPRASNCFFLPEPGGRPRRLAFGSDAGLLMEKPCGWCPGGGGGGAAPPEAEEMGASASAMLPSGAYLRGRDGDERRDVLGLHLVRSSARSLL